MVSITRSSGVAAAGASSRKTIARRAMEPPLPCALLRRRCHARPGGAADHDGLLEQIGGGVAHVGPRRNVFARLELHLAAALAGRDDLALHLDEIAGAQRGEELHRFISAEQSFVAVV